MMRTTLCMVLLFAGGLNLKAQEKTFSDEELTTYATVMVWAESEKKAISSVVSDSVSIWLESTGLSNSKYMELSKADKKDALQTVEATTEEFDEYAKIQDRIDAKAEKFKATYIDKIKNDIGASLYNGVKSALKSDEEVKARYDVIYAELKSNAESEDDTGDA